MTESELVDLGPRGFDSSIMPRVVLRIPMPPGTAESVRTESTRSVQTRKNFGLFGGQKRKRIATRLKAK